MSRRNVFTDPAMEAQFDKDGYVVVDFMTPDEVDGLFKLLGEIRKEGESVKSNTDSEYKLSFFADSPEYRMKILNEVGGYFQKMADRFLDRYQPLIINIFDKEPGGGEVPVHQNWTFVDESKYTSVSIWIPLLDVTRKNGTMEVVKGSHRVLTDYRSPSIPWCFQDLFDVLKDKYFEPLNLTLGQAAIIDDGILHYTSINETDTTRSTIQLILHPEDATPIHYYQDPENKFPQLEVFEASADFFTKFDMHKKPQDANSMGVMHFTPVNYSEKELVDKVAQNNPGILKQYQGQPA